MGLKALIYFEIITTLALVVGLVSINITRAGDGIQQPTQVESIKAAKPQTTGQIILLQPQTVTDYARHIENTVFPAKGVKTFR